MLLPVSGQGAEPGADGRVERMDAAGHPHLSHIWSQRGESPTPPRLRAGSTCEDEAVSHFLSVSQFIPVYMHVRVLVAAYLFQTGYGHFSFFWLKGDFSLYRVCQVILRSSSRIHLDPPLVQSRSSDICSSPTPGPVPSKLLGSGPVRGDGPALPVLLLCAVSHLLVLRHLRNLGHVASDPAEEGQW